MSVDEDLPSQKKAPLPLTPSCSQFPHCSHCYGNRRSLLGLCCIQSEWDLCRDSSGLHLFNLPHRNRLHAEKAGTKSRETPSPKPGMTSKIGATGFGLQGIWTWYVAKSCETHSKSKNRVAVHGHGQFQWKLCGIGFVIGSLRAWILGKYRVALALV